MMYFLEVSSENAYSILIVLGKILNLIHIFVPILLILLLSFDVAKAVLSNDDEKMYKVINNAKNRIIACIVIFFLPSIVNLIISKVSFAVNLDEEEYKKILDNYNFVINYKDIDVTDDSKTSDIITDLNYDITKSSNEEILKKENNEFDFNETSKSLSCLLFSSGYINYSTIKVVYNGLDVDNKTLNILFDEIIVNSTKDNDTSIVSNVTLLGKDKSYNVDYHYIFEEKNYVLDYIKIDDKNILDDYLVQIKNNENNKEIVANNKFSTINTDQYDYSKLNELTDNDIKKIYNKNINNVVMINTYYNSAVINSASGFFISDGVIVTSWSFIQNSLINGNKIIVHDINNNSFKPIGIISIDKELDIVVVKLDKKVNRKVNIELTSSLEKNDPVITIVSKTGYGLTTQSGIAISNDNDIISLLPLSSKDWGSPLFDSNGNVVGMNTSKIVNSTNSISSSLDKIKELQKELNSLGYNNIKYKVLDELKKEYFYLNKNKELVSNSVDKKVWDKYKKIGDVENSIFLNLVKSSYYDDILSLRYENPTSNYISTISYANDFISNLEKDGYKKTYDSKSKIILSKGGNKIIIMEEFNYLIVVIAKGGIL